MSSGYSFIYWNAYDIDVSPEGHTIDQLAEMKSYIESLLYSSELDPYCYSSKMYYPVFAIHTESEYHKSDILTYLDLNGFEYVLTFEQKSCPKGERYKSVTAYA